MLIAGSATAAHGTAAGIIHHASAAWQPNALSNGSTASATSSSAASPGGASGSTAAKVSLDRLLQVRIVALSCTTHDVRRRLKWHDWSTFVADTVTLLCTGCQQRHYDAKGWRDAAARGGSVPRGPCRGPLWPPQPAVRAPHQHHGAAPGALLLLTLLLTPTLQIGVKSTLQSGVQLKVRKREILPTCAVRRPCGARTCSSRTWRV